MARVPSARRAPRLWEVVVGLLLFVAFVLWAVKAFGFPATADAGLMYAGGEAAWATGRPERLQTWISTPFLALVMALVSRVMHAYRFSKLLTGINLVIVVGTLAAVWARLRSQLSIGVWWLTLSAAVLFAPLVSAVWWRQVSVLGLVFAIVGFEAARRRKPMLSGALIALSLSLKPVLLLLPLAMLMRRDSRRAALWTISFGAVFEVLAQLFLAWRAKDGGVLLPIEAYRNFASKALPNTTAWVCHPENFAPQSTLCRLAGSGQRWGFQRVVVAAFVVVAILVAADVLRGRAGVSWHIFAFASLLSPMISPIAWSHYQMFLGPMLLLLAVEFHQQRASRGQWLILFAGFLLAEMIWRPFFTLPNSIPDFIYPIPPARMFVDFAVSQFAQYFVLAAAFIWFHGSAGRAGCGVGKSIGVTDAVS